MRWGLLLGNFGCAVSASNNARRSKETQEEKTDECSKEEISAYEEEIREEEWQEG